jgi:hypothetical protein
VRVSPPGSLPCPPKGRPVTRDAVPCEGLRHPSSTQ